MRGGPHLLDRSPEDRRNRRARVFLDSARVRIGGCAFEWRRPPTEAMPLEDAVDQRPEQPHMHLIGDPLQRTRRDCRNRVGAVEEVRGGHRERNLLHLVIAETGTTKRLEGISRSRRPNTRLSPPEGDRGGRPWCETRTQFLLYALDSGLAHPLAPK